MICGNWLPVTNPLKTDISDLRQGVGCRQIHNSSLDLLSKLVYSDFRYPLVAKGLCFLLCLLVNWLAAECPFLINHSQLL